MLNLPKFLFHACRHDLGDAVGEQLEDAVFNGAGWEDQNPAALRMCQNWLDENFTDFAETFNDTAMDELNAMVHNLDRFLDGDKS